MITCHVLATAPGLLGKSDILLILGKEVRPFKKEHVKAGNRLTVEMTLRLMLGLEDKVGNTWWLSPGF